MNQQVIQLGTKIKTIVLHQLHMTIIGLPQLSQRFLNNKYYNGNKTGTVTYYSGASGGTSTSLNMSNIGLKNDSTRNMIANTTLKIGGWSSYSIFPHQVYEYERGTTVYSGRPTTWYGKIGLMYLLDYVMQQIQNYANKIYTTTKIQIVKITLGVNWTPAKIKITLNANGGTVGTSAIWYYYGINTFYSNEACTTKITSITVPTRYGYTFNHYYGDGSSGGNNGERYIYSGGTFADDLVTDIYQSTTFYANWSESLIYRYVKPLIGLNCRSGAGSSYSIVTAFSCGTRLALDPNPTNGWYYSAANGC